ncbi:SusC/RagA family TonB-linked outer membrane protein [Chitinophaga silvisoli]|uniref:SusC/RagA family TonB-linked outer membrane protein n=1 Tax=Chitinophaga silvisoli TaxID=2291814 RepID=A0A3E1NNK0_9BACT|nr:SusC/RagA family TonB-linked outer membrane protein [Chitinophaga silvisoli]RFM29368.1 SusC/RagA family TonB-linked outer membrane protein [Chitinophaga silvisoli]
MEKNYTNTRKSHPSSSRRKCLLPGLFGALLFLLFPFFAPAQNPVVTGRVTDSLGNGIADVTIAVKGTTVNAKTDASGNFSIQVSKGVPLRASHVSYISREVIPDGKPLTIVLRQATNELNNVVVIGYGTMKKKDLTGAITSIRPNKIADENPKTVQDIIRGTPGVSVGLDPSAKGGGTIRIRGQRSVYTDGGHNDPLLILDGMIFYGELSEINPDDIDQIDILKDASAAAIYGAKSANGVLIITTKKGKKGKPTINLTSNLGLSDMAANRKVFGPDGYMQYRQDWYTAATYGINSATGAYEPYISETATAGKPGYYEMPTDQMLGKYGITIDQWRAYSTNTSDASDKEIQAKRLGLQFTTLDNYLKGKTFDWYKHSFRTGFNQDYNLSVSGASDKINYYLSAGFLSNQGVVVGDNYRAVRSNLKVDGKVTDWLDISANVNFQDRSDGNIAVNWGSQIINNSPFASYKDEEGNLEVHPMGDEMTASKGYNFDFNKQYMKLERGYTVLNTIFSARVKLPFNIKYSFNISPRYQWYYNRYFESAEHPDWLAINHGVDRNWAKRFDWSLNNTLSWDKTFAQKHKVNVTLVQEAEQRRYWSDVINARNILPSDALGFHETSTGDPLNSSFDTDDSRETADGMLARVFYSYDDRYMLTASVRRDGYSAFGTSNPRATFFSTALAWTFTNEKFFHWSPLSNGKLRLSYGQNGNRSLANPYIALANLANGATTQGYVDANGSYIQYYYLRIDRMANPHLQWEKTTAYNIGLDLAFLNNRISTALDYYYMPTTNMIMSQSLPDFSGFTSITTNLGEVQNKGFEISVNTQNIRTSNFNWNTSFGFSKYKNTVKHLYYRYEDVLDANGNVVATKESDDISNGWFIGQPISAIWNYRVTGIWQVDEVAEAAKYGQRPGDPKVANNYTADDIKNPDGTTTAVYNNKDKEFLGQTSSPVMWSLRNDFTYKNFNFSFNIYSYWGNKSLSTSYLNQDNSVSLVTYNGNTYEKKYWTPDHPSNFWGRLDARGPSGVAAPNRIFNRSFIRLDNVSIGYTMPHKLLSPAGIENLKIYATVRNAAVWKKDKNWNYWDIETGDIAPRIYTLGLNVTL